MIKYQAQVTYEFMEDAPETWKGFVDAASHATAASRAMKEARRAFPGRRPASIVCLLVLPARMAWFK